jgi:hypothetical protein
MRRNENASPWGKRLLTLLTEKAAVSRYASGAVR